MALKYQTSDGQTFDNIEKAEEHEAAIAHLVEIRSHIEQMLDSNDILGAANRTRAKNIIELWEAYRVSHDVPYANEAAQGDLFDEAA